MPVERFHLAYDSICDILEYRLNQIGEIRLNDAWIICRRNHGYSMIGHVFRVIMQGMVEQGKAQRHPGKKGVYLIIKPYDPKANVNQQMIIVWGYPKITKHKFNHGIYEISFVEDHYPQATLRPKCTT